MVVHEQENSFSATPWFYLLVKLLKRTPINVGFSDSPSFLPLCGATLQLSESSRGVQIQIGVLFRRPKATMDSFHTLFTFAINSRVKSDPLKRSYYFKTNVTDSSYFSSRDYNELEKWAVDFEKQLRKVRGTVVSSWIQWAITRQKYDSPVGKALQLATW